MANYSSNLALPVGAGNFGQNPYTDNLANKLTASSNLNLNQNIMPQINQGAQMAGQYGGSRQGIAQGVAAGNAQVGLDTSIAGLYANAYRDDLNSFTQNRSQDQNFYLGNQGQMQNFYTQQRGQDQSGMALGAQLYGTGNTGNLGIGAGQTQLGQSYMNAPINALNTYQNFINPYASLNGTSSTDSGGGSTSTTTISGDPGSAGQQVGGGLQGALGGAMAGYQFGNNLGLG
jgi:hypothetical protein